MPSASNPPALDRSPHSNVRTACEIFAISALTSLFGDACHVASGTTTYMWPAVPSVWRSAIWFPVLVGLSMLGVANSGRELALPSVVRTRADVASGIAAVLAFYALTATLRGQSPEVAVVLTGGIALLLWRLWDPSRTCLAVATLSAIVGPSAEIGLVKLGAVRYASDSQCMWGVAPWLPCLYFGACAVGSGLWASLRMEVSATRSASVK